MEERTAPPLGPDSTKPEEAARFAGLIGIYEDALRENRTEDAENAMLEILELAAEWADNDHSPEIRLKEEATHCENRGDWEGAEAAYRRMVALADAGPHPLQQCRDRYELAVFLTLVGRNEEALREAQVAAAFARQVDLRPLIAMALECVANCALAVGRIEEARRAAEESLTCLGTDPLFSLQRARGLILRARCAVASNVETAAESDLDEAWQILAPLSNSWIMAAGRGGLAAWWSCTARLRQRQGDREGAEAAAGAAVERWRRLGGLPHLEGVYVRNALAQSLHFHGQTLADAGLPYQAEEAFAESRDIRKALRLPPLG